MPKLNQDQLNQLKFVEDYASRERKAWNAFALSAINNKKWQIYGDENKMNVLLLKALFVLMHKEAVKDNIMDRTISNPDIKTGHKDLFENVDDLDFFDKNEDDPDVVEAVKCINILKGYFEGLVHEDKMKNDPVYVANYAKKQEKEQKEMAFSFAEKHLANLPANVLFEKNLSIANPDELMKVQFKDLSEDELNQCEAAYDELFKVPATGEILSPEDFYALNPLNTNVNAVAQPLTEPKPEFVNETEEAKKLRLKKGKAEVLRALLDPARKLEYRSEFFDRSLSTSNINFDDSKKWDDAVLKKKADYNKSFRDDLTNVLANPAPEVYLLESYDAVNQNTGIFDLSRFSPADYSKCLKAAEIFDKMFKPLSDKRAEIGLGNVEKEVYYKNYPIYTRISDDFRADITSNGWDASVIAKAMILHYLSSGNKNLSFRPLEFSRGAKGFAPVEKQKGTYSMVLTGNVAEQANALKAQQDGERNRLIKENDDAEKAFDDEFGRKENDEINGISEEKTQLTDNFVNALNEKQIGLGAQNRNILESNAKLIVEQKHLKKESEEYSKSVSDNKYTYRNLKDQNTYSFINAHNLLGSDLIENFNGQAQDSVEKTLNNSGLKKNKSLGGTSTMAILMYAFGVKGMTLDQVLGLNKADRFALSKEALAEFDKRPITGEGVTSQEQVKSNLAWYGEMVKKANLTVFKNSGINFPDLNRIDTEKDAEIKIMRNDKFGFAYEYATFMLPMIKNWTNKSNKTTAENRFGIDQRKEFLKSYDEDIEYAESGLESDISCAHSIIGLSEAMLSYKTKDININDNPNTYINRIKMVKHDLMFEQYQSLSGKSIYHDHNQLPEVGLKRRAICECDFDNRTMDQLSKADEKNAERLLGLKSNPHTMIPVDLIKDQGILKLATKTAGLSSKFRSTEYIRKEVEDAFAIFNDKDKPEILELDFNKPENVGKEPDYENLKTNEDLLDKAEDTFDDLFRDYFRKEEAFEPNNDAKTNLILFDRFKINGVSAKDLLIQKTGIQDYDFQNLTLRTKLGKAMILHAMADPNANITFTPIALGFYANPIPVKNYTNELHLQRQQEIRGLRMEELNAPEPEFKPFENINEELAALNVNIPAHMDDTKNILTDANLSNAYALSMRFKPYPHLQEFREILEDVCGTKPDPKVVDLGFTQQQINGFFRKACLNDYRTTTHTSDFSFYLMGVKGLSFEEAARMNRNHPDYERNVKDFIAFVKNHPISEANPGDPALTPAKRRENIKAWTDLFLKANEKIMAFKLPDIDYSDPKQVALHQRELSHLSLISMDYYQEVGELINSPYSADIRLAAGGFEKLQAARSSMSPLNGIAFGLKKAYFDNPTQMPVAVNIRTAAINRALLKDLSNDIKGKEYKEIYKNANRIVGKTSIFIGSPNDAMRVTDPNLSTDKAIEYLQGKNNDFENSFLAGQPERINQFCNQTNLIKGSDAAFRFAERNNLNEYRPIRQQLNTIFAQNQNANQLYNTFIANEDRTLLNAAIKTFHAFEGDVEKRIKRNTYGVSLLDTIRIDGKTPGELWGDKYNFVEKPEEKQTMYAIEILKEFYTGKKPITMDSFSLDANGNVNKSGCVYLAKDLATIQRGHGLLNYISKLHNDLSAMKQKLTNADRRASRADRNRLRANNQYNEMMTALDRCIDASDVNNNNKSVDDFYAALQKFREKAETYQKQREHLSLNEKLHPNVAPRLAKKGVAAEAVRFKQTNDAIKLIPEAITKITNMASPFGILYGENERIGKNEDPGKYGQFRSMLELEANLRNISVEEATRPVDVNRTWNNENEYQWLSGLNGDNWMIFGADEEQIKQINEDFKVGYGEELGEYGIEQGSLLLGPAKVNQKFFENVGFIGSREDTAFGIFAVWLMGKKGYDIQTLGKIFDKGINSDGNPKNAELMRQIEKDRAEFIRFCTNNPVKHAEGLTDQQYDKSVEEWANVFMAATAKMKSYKLPEIDYSDPVQGEAFLNEFMVLRQISINFGQEFPKLLKGDHPYKPSKDLFEEKLRAVGGTQKLYDEWLKVQPICSVINYAHLAPRALTDQPIGIFFDDLTRTSCHRFYAGEYLNPVKGRTLGEVSEKYGNKMMVSDNTPYIMSKPFVKEPPHGSFDFSKDAVGYALGQNKDAFLKKAKESLTRVENENFKRSNRFSLTSSARITDIKFGDLRNRFNSLDDSPEAMKNFLKERVAPDEKSVRYWVNDAFKSHLIHDEQYRFMVIESGLKYSDCMKFDGKTPEELWGAKYANETAEEKEALLLAECMRKIAKGDSAVSMRQFHMTSDGVIQDAGFKVALESNAKLEAMQEAAIGAYITEKELLGELKEIQKTLQGTQENRSANLSTNMIRTGSDLYQDLCIKLDKCIIMLEKSTSNGDGNNVNRHDVVTALNDFSKANETYYNERKGILISPRKDYGKKRLATTVKAYETLSAYSQRLSRYLESYSSDMLVKDTTMESADSNYIRDKAVEIRKFLGKAPIEEDDMKNTYLYDSLAQKSFELQAMKNFKLPENKAKDPEEKEKYDLAFKYVKLNTVHLINTKTATLNDLNKLDHLNERVAELANNPALCLMMKANPKGCAEVFRAVEQKALTNLAKCEAEEKEYGTIKSMYVVLNQKNNLTLSEAQKTRGINSCIKLAQEEDYGARNNNNNIKNAKGYREVHERLAEVLLAEILADPADGKHYRQLIASDEIANQKHPEADVNRFRKILKNQIYKILTEEKKAMEKGNVKSTLQKLENGDLKKEVSKSLKDIFKQHGNALDKQAEHNAQNQMANGPGMGAQGF